MEAMQLIWWSLMIQKHGHHESQRLGCHPEQIINFNFLSVKYSLRPAKEVILTFLRQISVEEPENYGVQGNS